MKRIHSLSFFCITMLLAFTSCSLRNSRTMEDGDLWIIERVDTLSYLATHIVKAEVVDSRAELISTILREPATMDEELFNDVMRINTVYRLRVLEVFKGDVGIGDMLEVAQPGGRLGNDELIYYGHLDLVYGDALVFFLRCFYEHGFGHWPMALTAGNQSVYRATALNTDDGIVAAYNFNPGLESLSLESLCNWNELVLTIGDLILIRYEAGLGPRPYNLQPPIGVDRSRLNKDIDIAEYHLPQNYNRPGWDNVQILLNEAIRVRDNPYSRQMHVNHASFDLRHAIRALGIDTDAPVPTPRPTEACREALSTAITTAQSLGAHNYTPETWAILQLALQAAITVYETETATQAQIDEAADSLWEAIYALEPEDTEPTVICIYILMDAIAHAEYRRSHPYRIYSETSMANLQGALDAALYVVYAYNNNQATFDQIGEATWSLQTAINALEFIGYHHQTPPPSTPTPPPSNTIDYVQVISSVVTYHFPARDINVAHIGDMIRGIPTQMPVGAIVDLPEVMAINNADGTPRDSSDFVGTGTVIVFENGTTLTVVVLGCLTGRGLADMADFLSIRLHILEISILEAPYLIAADLNGDGIIDDDDLMIFHMYRMGFIDNLPT